MTQKIAVTSGTLFSIRLAPKPEYCDTPKSPKAEAMSDRRAGDLGPA